MSRVIAYIDGFNLYHGIRDSGWPDCMWLDMRALAQTLLKGSQELVEAKYFTAKVRYPRGKVKRQRTYLDALEAHGGLGMFYGRYQKNIVECRNCGSTWRNDNEKMTDVRIAVEMMTDAAQNRFDIAFLVSGDGDLVPPIESIRELWSNKQVIVFFPPDRRSTDLEDIAHASLAIWRRSLLGCQLPDPVINSDGFPLARPPSWS